MALIKGLSSLIFFPSHFRTCLLIAAGDPDVPGGTSQRPEDATTQKTQGQHFDGRHP